MTNLTVQTVSLVGNDTYSVNFTGEVSTTAVPGAYPMATQLTLNLSEKEARTYFPGDVYELSLKKK